MKTLGAIYQNKYVCMYIYLYISIYRHIYISISIFIYLYIISISMYILDIKRDAIATAVTDNSALREFP